MMKNVIGFSLLAAVVVLWVGSSTLIQTIFEEIDFNKPFFLTYFATSLFSLYFIDIFRRREEIRSQNLPQMGITAKTAAQFCPLWFGANYLYNLSLTTTSIASSTILSSTSGIFTLLLSIFILKSSADVLKFVAVLVSFGGTVCIALADWDSSSETAYGDFMALGGAIIYSLYCIFIASKSKDVYLPHMFAFVGIINFICLMPLFPILSVTGIEKFEFPNGEVLGFLLLNGLFGTVLSDVLWAFSVKYLNPALCTLGISLTIPLSMAVDAVLHSFTYSVIYIFGALFIVAGFFIMAAFEHPKYGHNFSNKGIMEKCLKKRLLMETNDSEFSRLNLNREDESKVIIS
jgi:solute carrier family 35, member F5